MAFFDGQKKELDAFLSKINTNVDTTVLQDNSIDPFLAEHTSTTNVAPAETLPSVNDAGSTGAEDMINLTLTNSLSTTSNEVASSEEVTILTDIGSTKQRKNTKSSKKKVIRGTYFLRYKNLGIIILQWSYCQSEQ